MSTAGPAVRGRVLRVAGPLVEVTGLPGATMSEIVALGSLDLPGEVVALRDGVATIQAYEYTGGLAPGDPVDRGGAPLSAPLGPALLGAVVDGLLRPLTDAGPWLRPGRSAGPPAGSWAVRPLARTGAPVAAGSAVAVVAVPDAPDFLVLVPPGVAGLLEDVAPPGEYPADAVLAAVATGRGDLVPVPMTQQWPIRRPRPYHDRVDRAVGLTTGQRVIDQLFPIARGSSVAVPGGFGTGKTMLLQQVAKWCDADVIVYVGCGERGNEMADVVADLRELVDPRTGRALARRTVVVANTSNMPMMAREASIHSGVTVAEVFRDMGYHTVVIADSTSRWAEALREFASRSGALPAEEGYPAGLASALAAFYERAGHVVTLGGRDGSVSIVGAVSPPGGDRAEPVTANTERFVRAVWSLDRDLAYARHYPAVAWAGSFSRDADALAVWHTEQGDPDWPARRARVLRILADADRLQALADLVGLASLPGSERIVLLSARLLRDAVLQQSALHDADASCSAAKGAALIEAVLTVADRCQALVEQGVAASRIEEHDVSSLVRAREETGPADVAGVQRRLDDLLATLDGLVEPADES